MERLRQVVTDDMISNNPDLVGSGFFDPIAKGFSDVGNWIGSNILKPAVKVLPHIIEPLADAASFVAPELAPTIQIGEKIAKPLAEKAASQMTGSGAFGLGQMYANAILKEHPELRGKGTGLENFIEGMVNTASKVSIDDKALLPHVLFTGKGKRKPSWQQARAQAMKKIMKSRGVSLCEASKILKEENIKY